MPTIDNQGENTMANALKAFLPATERLDVLVGYFYFSGFQEIYKELADKKIRILVGMDIDTSLIYSLNRKDPSNLYEIRTAPAQPGSILGEQERYFDSLEKIFNDTDWFENIEAQNAFEVFVKKIADGTLEIKKSLTPRHDKLFIFHYAPSHTSNGFHPGSVITGSSNLSRSGLVSRSERNKIHEDKENYLVDSAYFEEAWNDSENITIADLGTQKKFISEIEKRLFIYQKPSPYHLYLRVLKELFTNDIPQEGIKGPNICTGGKFADYKYQLDGIEFGLDRINKYNGAIIADVVGLGKSVISSAIAHNLGKRTIIICPPHLADQWEDYRSDFNFNARVFTTGKLTEAMKYRDENKKPDEEWLVIVDEAHKFRNEETGNYHLLYQICTGNNVLLLTATPFNNDPKDLFALVKLFDTPGASTIQTVENLSVEFRELFTKYKKLRKRIRTSQKDDTEIRREGESIAQRLRELVGPVMLRRSRTDLRDITVYADDLKKQGIDFAKVHAPKLIEYPLGKLSTQYLNTLTAISPNEGEQGRGLEGARYKTVSYLLPESTFFNSYADFDELIGETGKKQQQQIDQAQVNVAKFMRRLLVRRFESSLPAFKSTLKKILAETKKTKDYLENQGYVIVMKKGELIDEEELADMLDEEREAYFAKIEEKGAIRIPAKEFKPTLSEDLDHDIELLESIYEMWFGANVFYEDPKFDKFKQLISEHIEKESSRKIIVFSEFADTTNAVYEEAKKSGLRVMKYTSADASPVNKEIIKANFDASYKGTEQDDFDILIATDAISEGYNLHRAGIIINYDIPFNPTRVIQRIGRINRVNKKVFDDLYIYNFFPTDIGEDETQIKAISTLKMHMIQALLGDDAKALTDDEILHNYFAEDYKRAEEKDNAEKEWGWQKKHRNVWESVKNDVQTMNIVSNIKHRVRIGRNMPVDIATVSFARRGNTPIFGIADISGKIQLAGPEKTLEYFIALEDEESMPVTDSFQGLYDHMREELFRNNSEITCDGRRQRALEKIDALKIYYPELDATFRDIRKLIYFDALPEGVYKSLAELKNNDNFEADIESIISKKFIIEKLANIHRNTPKDEIIYFSEQFLG